MIDHEIDRIAAAINRLPGEQWRPIPGYERTYAVSSLGRVYSLPRPTTSGGLLKGSPDKHGYPKVNLVQDGKQRTRRTHVLVALTFLGPCPDGMEIRHLDGTRNPALSNLAYGTHAENMRDMQAHGTCSSSNKTHCPHGHEYAGDNVVIYDGRRYCRECRRQRWRRSAA